VEHLVHNDVEFVAAIAALHSGDTIRLLGSIDLPANVFNLQITAADITIVGGQSEPTSGIEPRPEIRCKVAEWAAPDTASLLVLTNAARVKFLNVGIKGGYAETAILTPGRRRGAVRIQSGSSIELCNCTLTGWPFYGVRVDPNASAMISNCDIRSCRQDGLGYGVAVYGGNATIEYCVFKACRHAIAASAADTGTYVARHNQIFMTDPHHAVDVHGAAALPPFISLTNFVGTRHDTVAQDYDPANCGGVAGKRFIIEGNTIVNDSGAPEEAIVIRGQPVEFCSIYGNTIARCTIKIPKHADKRRFYVYGNVRDDNL